MPVRFSHSTGSYEIHCTRCETRVPVLSRGALTDESAVATTGAMVRDTFRFHRGHQSGGRFLGYCRSCERAARSNRTRSPRVPGTTGVALGINRRFGVEFECVVPANISRATIEYRLSESGLRTGSGGWRIKGDGSITSPRGFVGVEVVSPPMSGEDGEDQVRKVARVLRSLGARVNRSCGTHVHHDANDLTVDQIKRVARGWFRNQEMIDGLVAPSRRGPTSSYYCRPLSDAEVGRIERVENLEDMRRVPVDRYRTLNLQSYGRHGTIEIRQHQGTLDAEKVISWLRLGQAIIDTSKVGDRPLGQAHRLRDLFDALGERLDSTARTFLTGRAVEFNTVTV